jgi:hypothetical protein
VHGMLILCTLIGLKEEGIRNSQIPLCVSIAIHTVLVILVTWKQKTFYVLTAGLVASLYYWWLYGELDFSNLKTTGPYRVGYREFTTSEYGAPCSIFYPAADDGSGVKGVSYFTYGEL